MADVDSIKMEKKDVRVTLNVSMQEYQLLTGAKKHFTLFPADSETLNERLTTGKLGRW